jgi:predicted nucleotidyltransferase
MYTDQIMQYQFIQKLAELPFIDQIWLFGSRARGDHSPRSDIDLAISCASATNLEWTKVLDIIDQADTLLKIDCVRFDRLQPNEKLVKNISQFKKLLYAKED